MLLKIRAIVLLSFIILQLSAQDSSTQDTPQFDNENVFVLSGLAHLSFEDKTKISAMILKVKNIGRSQSSRDLMLSSAAKNYLVREGYRVHYLSIVAKGLDRYLVASDGLSRWATKDTGRFIFLHDGYYYCKPYLLGGISEYIEENGSTEQVIAFDWKEIR